MPHRLDVPGIQGPSNVSRLQRNHMYPKYSDSPPVYTLRGVDP